MKGTLPAAALTALTLLTGCNSPLHAAGFAYKDLFRQQIEESVPVKDWGYKVQEIRLSDDSHKALIVLLAPARTIPQDLILNDDGFRRYTGGMLDLVRQAAAKSGDTHAC